MSGVFADEFPVILLIISEMAFPGRFCHGSYIGTFIILVSSTCSHQSSAPLRPVSKIVSASLGCKFCSMVAQGPYWDSIATVILTHGRLQRGLPTCRVLNKFKVRVVYPASDFLWLGVWDGIVCLDSGFDQVFLKALIRKTI